MSDAISNKIKTQMATYIVDKTEYDSATSSEKAQLKALRLSNNTVVGTTAQIESDVILPNTRIKSVPETGSQSSSGSTESEWNIDEQDDFISAALCSEWEEDAEQETGNVLEYKTCTLGTERKLFYMFKYFDQNPKEWRKFNDLQVNQLSLDFALNSFVKMTVEWLGSNNPLSSTTDPAVNAEYNTPLTTKAFKTLQGYIKLGNDFNSLVAMRQSPAFNLAINRKFVKEGEERQTDFIPIVAWAKTGEFVSKYFKKGQQVGVIGRIQTRTWDDDQGQKHYITEVVAEEAYFADSKRDGETGGNFDATFGTMPEQPAEASDFEVSSGDDLPF